MLLPDMLSTPLETNKLTNMLIFPLSRTSGQIQLSQLSHFSLEFLILKESNTIRLRFYSTSSHTLPTTANRSAFAPKVTSFSSHRPSCNSVIQTSPSASYLRCQSQLPRLLLFPSVGLPPASAKLLKA